MVLPRVLDKNIFIFLFLFITSCNLFEAKKPEGEDSSAEGEKINNTEVSERAAHPAEFSGGNAEMMRYLSKNIKYPENCSTNEIQGKVYIEFVVDENGLVTKAKVKKGVHPELDNEALRVVKSMPRWNPAHDLAGNSVKQRYVLPVNFKIQ